MCNIDFMLRKGKGTQKLNGQRMCIENSHKEEMQMTKLFMGNFPAYWESKTCNFSNNTMSFSNFYFCLLFS